MTYYTRQILGSDGQKRTYVFCDLPDGGTKSFPADKDNENYQSFKKDLANGAVLQDSDGNVIDGIAYLEELV